MAFLSRAVAWVCGLFGLGLFLVALSADVTVETELGGGRVVNVFLVEQRRQLLAFAGVIVGVAIVADLTISAAGRNAAIVAELQRQTRLLGDLWRATQRADLPQPTASSPSGPKATPERPWCYQAMGEAVGPLSGRELKELADRGRIDRDTKVRKNGGGWVEAGTVRGLFA